MVKIRSNPGVVPCQINNLIEVGVKQEDLAMDNTTNYNFGSTVKMRELQENLLEPDIVLRSPHNIVDYEDDGIIDRVDVTDKYGSVETLREGQYIIF